MPGRRGPVLDGRHGPCGVRVQPLEQLRGPRAAPGRDVRRDRAAGSPADGHRIGAGAGAAGRSPGAAGDRAVGRRSPGAGPGTRDDPAAPSRAGSHPDDTADHSPGDDDTGTHDTRANFSGADLPRADFPRADFPRVDFARAHFPGAHDTGADPDLHVSGSHVDTGRRGHHHAGGVPDAYANAHRRVLPGPPRGVGRRRHPEHDR
ncbi:pentapeptide repeat-containing protein [Geodermatophilus sp. URMC 64]